MIPAIDVSSNNQHGGIDWPAVAAYLTALHPEAIVLVKVNEADYVNPFLHQQRMGSHAAGIRNVGLYDYVRPSLNLGHEEAALFLKAIGDDGGVLPNEFYAMDNEDPNVAPDADLDEFTLDWLETVYRADGIRPFHYSAHYYVTPHRLRSPELASYPLWYASYQNTLPPVPAPWTKIAMWQYSASGRVPGIQGDVDLSYFMGTIEDLRAYQWGHIPDPLGGKLVAAPPDVAVNAKGEALDQGQTFVKIAGHLEAVRRLYLTRGTAVDDLVAVAQGDAGAGALRSGLVS